MSQNGSEDGERWLAGGERERAVDAPWPPLLLTLVLIGLYAWQRTFPDQEAIYDRYGLWALRGGDEWRLITALFVHTNWPHVLLNAAFGLPFGVAVARLFGPDVKGSLAFFLFFLVCGAFAGWAYLLLMADVPVHLVGASGAVSGLMGAGSRLLGRDPAKGRLAPFNSPQVIGIAAAMIILNLLVAVLGFAPGLGTASVAWEAHLFGYAAGLVLVGPVAWLLGRRPPKA